MLKRFRIAEEGAVLVYVALALVVLMGVVSLSFDLGRHYILAEELQKAADAAATAGAYQLDPGESQATVRQRAIDAAIGSAVTDNQRRLGNGPGGVTISDVYVLDVIPADDDTAIPDGDSGGTVDSPYQYVRVKTTAVASNNVFGRLLGQPSVTLEAEAVAKRGNAICQVTPLFVCNPAEAVNGAGADFILDDWIGKQMVAKDGSGSGKNAQWFPGNFGYLDVLGGGGANALAQALADQNGAPVCFTGNVQTKPGGTEGARNALNTRFDLYEQPMPGGYTMATMGPAENVRKGYQGSGCTMSPGAPPDYYKLPRDQSFQSFQDYPDARVGNGIWNCEEYWMRNHGASPPAGIYPNGLGDCTASTDGADLTRFQAYRYEIDNSLVDDPSTGGGETGLPQCNVANTVTSGSNDLSNDRRIINMAVVNCLEHADEISGGKTDLPVEAFVNGFLTEPTTIESNKATIYLEIVGTDNPGDDSIAEVIARDWVEVVR